MRPTALYDFGRLNPSRFYWPNPAHGAMRTLRAGYRRLPERILVWRGANGELAFVESTARRVSQDAPYFVAKNLKLAHFGDLDRDQGEDRV